MGNFQEKISFIWDLADLLRSVYKRNEYQKVILPFTVLKRFDCVLSDSRKAVLETYNKYKGQFENMEPILLNAAKDKNGRELKFYNYSKYDFKAPIEDAEHISVLQDVDIDSSKIVKKGKKEIHLTSSEE
ncbi:type I restriction-modification system subunit M N-terminal domain-containing protein [Candidatus Aerophobetes bacterium]|nr:type I restriction-modification system subunit M N-terminal domain-containing protein [Candidatus Aerophobetes bacterium]